MNKASTAKKVYEALPNMGRMFGVSAADIPKGSQLEKQKKGGMVKPKKKK
jgi:predicted RecA/RadA family phage recombinase